MSLSHCSRHWPLYIDIFHSPLSLNSIKHSFSLTHILTFSLFLSLSLSYYGALGFGSVREFLCSLLDLMCQGFHLVANFYQPPLHGMFFTHEILGLIFFLISVADYFGHFDDWFSIICASIIHYLRFSVSFKIWPQENILRMMGILCTDPKSREKIYWKNNN